MNHEPIDRFGIKVTDGKNISLGYNTGMGNRTFTGVNLRDLRAEPGWIISDNDVQPWETTELREIDGSLVFLGPWKTGRFFDPSRDNSPLVLKRLARVLLVLGEKESSLEIFGPAALYLCQDGSVIVFPPKVVNFVLGQLPVEEQLVWREPWAHPLFRGQKAHSWGMAVIAHRALTGENPWYGKDKAEIHDRIREGEFLKTGDIVPGIKPFIASMIDSTLSEEEPDNLPEPEDWIAFFEKWETGGAVKPLDSEEKKIWETRRKRGRKQMEKRFGFKRDLSTKGVTWLIVGLIAAALLFVAGSVIVSAMKPPLTRGMNADEVIHAFYQGINDLNYPLVMDCLGPEAEKEDAATVKQEHIMALQKTRKFGDNGIIRAQDWLADGQPPIPPFKTLFGLTSFKYSTTPDGKVEVRYIRWFTDLSNGIGTDGGSVSQTVILTGLNVTDILTLELKGKDWKITRIDRTLSPHYAKEVRWSEGGSLFLEKE